MKFSIKANLMLQFLAVGIVPLAMVTSVSLYLVKETIEKSEYRKLGAVREARIANLERFLDTSEKQVVAFSESRSTISAMEGFTREFHHLGHESQYSKSEIDAMRIDLQNLYSTELLRLFKEKNPNGSFEGPNSINSLSADAVVAQHAYMAKNPNPFGSKANMSVGADGSEYSRIHSVYHDYYKNMLEKFAMYDIFLVDSQTGDIVYSVTKEMDFATNLKTGPFANGPIGEAFDKARRSTNNDYVYLTDIGAYAPSFGAPAAFISTPIVKNGKNIGVFIAQLHTGVVETIMNERYGMGKTGEAYLVGQDGLMRSDAHFNKDLKLENSFLFPDTGRIETEFASRAFTEKPAYGTTLNYNGDKVLSTFGKIDHLGVTWGIIVDKGMDEALGPLMNLMWIVTGITLFSIAAILGIAWILGNSISNPILRIAQSLKGNSGGVADASGTMQDSSRKLSEMAGEQACSIEETAASIEEISAMVKNNVDQADKSSALSKQVQELASQGNTSMEQLIQSMNEIMASNQQIQELVTVIEEIGNKTEVIDEIVFQTKLLSFNASVEAERAGEHGRGFAVVAQEVGNLAQMSGKAALEIASMVKSSVKSAEQITKEAKRKVESGNQLVNETAKYLKDINANAGDMTQQAAQILVSSKEQSDGISQVNEAMSHLDQATQQNSATAEATEVSSKNLGIQAVNLQNNIRALMDIVHGKGKGEEQEQKAQDAGAASNVVQLTDYQGDQAPSAMPAAKTVAGGSTAVNSSGGDDWEKL